jgi:hypothetical protein
MDYNAAQCYQLQANSGFDGQENWRVLGDDRHGRPGKREQVPENVAHPLQGVHSMHTL